MITTPFSSYTIVMQKSATEFIESLGTKKVLIWGLGLNGGGVGAAEFFAKHAMEVKVIDMKSEEELKESVSRLSHFSKINYDLGPQSHTEENFLWADLIIRNPAIPDSASWLEFCQDNNKDVQMEAALFLKHTDAYTIGITGTRGKSTTTAALTDILNLAVESKNAGWEDKKIITGGNNRISLLNLLTKTDEKSYIVMELSSFQLAGLKGLNVSPDLAVVTNLYPDHLNWHGSMDEYVAAKGNILKFQQAKDIKVLNSTNSIVMESYADMGEGHPTTFGENVKDGQIQLNATTLVTNAEVKTKGEHNLMNLAAAATAANALHIDQTTIKQALLDFEGLEYRQQFIAEVGGVKYYNDSTSTMPEALQVCLERFSQEAGAAGSELHLICGGMNKDLNMEHVPELITNYVHSVHMLEGTFFDEIFPRIDDNKVTKFGSFNNMREVVESAASQAQPGDIVVFSPAATSFNLFANEFDRAEKFNQAVANLNN